MANVLIDQLNNHPKIWISGSKGQFLELGRNHSTNYLIFSALGKIELNGTLAGDRRIDIRSLSRGIYFIQLLINDETQLTQQFMKL